MMKRTVSVLLLIVMVLSFSAAAYAGTEETAVRTESVAEADGANMLKYGSIDISLPTEELLAVFSPGDVVTVTLGDFGSFDVPVCRNYDDVAAGEMLLRAADGKPVVTLAKNYGQVAVDLGLVESAPEGSDFAYRVREDAVFPIPVTIELKDQGGYLDRLRLGVLTRTNDISDYPSLSEAEFANFRMVNTSGIEEGVLYRSSSPIDPDIGRNTYADNAAREAGVRTVINLCNSRAAAEAYDGFADTYCSGQNIVFLNLPVSFASEEFRNGFRRVFSAVAEGEPPFLVHCSEGKDRAGLTSAVLEALMGASADEIMDDYLTSYINYYDVKDGIQNELSEELKDTIRSIIAGNLKFCCGIDLMSGSSISGSAGQYLLDIGVTADEISSIRMKLGEKK